jgi:hypothetical protein
VEAYRSARCWGTLNSLDNRVTNGCKVVSSKHRPRFTPQKHFISPSGNNICKRKPLMKYFRRFVILVFMQVCGRRLLLGAWRWLLPFVATANSGVGHVQNSCHDKEQDPVHGRCSPHELWAGKATEKRVKTKGEEIRKYAGWSVTFRTRRLPSPSQSKSPIYSSVKGRGKVPKIVMRTRSQRDGFLLLLPSVQLGTQTRRNSH